MNSQTTLTKQEAAKDLRICVRHLENLLKARALSFMKIGKSVRISREALDAFKASHTVTARK